MGDRVRLTADMPEAGLKAGDAGRVAMIYSGGVLYVEFDGARPEGPEAALAWPEVGQVEPA